MLGYIDSGICASPGNFSDRARVVDAWPNYPLSQRFNATADVGDIPTLLLNGDLDAQTPLSSALAQKDHLRGSNIKMKVLVGAAHGTVFVSPTKTPRSLPCGLQMFLSFLRNPLGPTNDSCMADLLPVEFRVPAALARSELGVDDAYDGVPVAPTPSPTPESPPSSSGVSTGLFWGLVAPLAAATAALLLSAVCRMRRRSRDDDPIIAPLVPS